MASPERSISGVPGSEKPEPSLGLVKEKYVSPAAKELLSCSGNLDFGYLRRHYEGEGCVPIIEAQRTASRHLAQLAELVEEMKLQERGFFILIDNRKYDRERDTPGSIAVFLGKDEKSAAVYQQTFGSFFLRTFREEQPDREGLRRAIERAVSEIEIEGETTQKKKGPVGSESGEQIEYKKAA